MSAGFDAVAHAEAAAVGATETCSIPAAHPSRSLYDPAGAANGAQPQTNPRSANWRAALRLIRPHQWTKNLLLFVPLIVGHRWTDGSCLFATCMAFVAFCCCASAIYAFNDLLDLEADRRHPEKRRRPLASGELSPASAIRLFALLLALGLAVSFATLPLLATLLIGLYSVLTVIYSLTLKRQPIADVFLLAGLYTLRILVGGVAARIAISGWLMAFSIFFFQSLALVKRYAELLLASSEQRSLVRRGYIVEDLGLIQSLGSASGYMAILTFCFYINAPNVFLLYRHPDLLWGVSLVLFFWITRIWFLAQRRRLKEDPVAFATRDPVSYFAGLVVLSILILAAHL